MVNTWVYPDPLCINVAIVALSQCRFKVGVQCRIGVDVSCCTGIVTSFTFICMHIYSYSINRISFRQAIVTSRSTVDYIRWFSVSFLLICAKCMYLLKFLIRYVDLVDMIDTNLCVLGQ